MIRGIVAKTRQPRTLLELCIARATDDPNSVVATLRSTPRAMRVCQYVVEWAIALSDGSEPTVSDVARYWNEPIATAFRRNREFRELFTGEKNPARLGAPLIERVTAADRRDRDVDSLMQVPLAV